MTDKVNVTASRDSSLSGCSSRRSAGASSSGMSEREVDAYLSEVAVAALDQAPQDEAHQEVGLRLVLRQLEAPQDNHEVILNHLEDRVLNAMDRHDGEGVHTAATAVINCLCDDEKTRSILAEKSAAKSLLRSLESHAESNPVVAANVCEALCKLGSIDKEVLQVIYAEGAVNNLLVAMEAHPEMLELQSAACSLLANLAVQPEARELMAKNNAADLVVKALELHEDENALSIALAGCAALANFAVDPRLRAAMMENGAVGCLAKSLISHPDFANVHLSSAFAIASLAETQSNQRKLVEQGVDTALLRAMQLFPDNAEVLVACIVALCNLAADVRTRVSMVEVNCVDNVVLQAMARHPEHCQLQESAARLLANLAINRDNQVLLVEKQAVEMLRTAQETHQDNKLVYSAVEKAIDRLQHCVAASGTPVADCA